MSTEISEQVLLASGARTSTQTLAPIDNQFLFDGLEVTLDLTAFTTAASLTLRIEFFDPGKNDYVLALASAVISATGTTVLRVSPVTPTVANQSLTAFIPKRFRVVVNHGNGNSHTYSVSSRLVRLFG
jgi:hypothetical protein